MRKAAQAALVVGVISLVIGVISRLTLEPIRGIEAHAIVQFAQACFLFSIAGYLASCKRS